MNFLFNCDGKKGDLLKAGLELFAAKGINGVSVRDIARAAGVSEAALYKHFTGKEDMALYLYSAILGEYTGRVSLIERQPGRSLDKLCRIIELTYSLFDTYPAEIHFALLSQAELWEQVPAAARPFSPLAAIMTAGMGRGEMQKQDICLAVCVFMGIMLQPLLQYPKMPALFAPPEELSKQVGAIVRKTFGI